VPNINEKQWTALRQRRPCWECKYNEVSERCNDCLSTTVVFERTDGTVGVFKPNFKRGNNWNLILGGD
jgi:hypothetical protein